MKTIKVWYAEYLDASFMVNNSSMGVAGRDLIYELLSKHYNVEFTDKDPDIVFCWMPRTPIHKVTFYKFDCVRVYVGAESEVPDFNNFDYAFGGYHDYKFHDRYCYIPTSIFCENNYETSDNYRLAQHKHENVDQSLLNREFCSFTVTNCTGADLEREEMFHLLSEYKKVDSGGKYLNNVGGPVKCKRDFDIKHKFSIAFENISGCFITEKLDAAFAGQTVPIYWGNPYVTDIYNNKAFINCYDYSSFDEVKKKVIELDNNDEEYLRMLREPAFKENIEVEDWEKKLEEFLVRIAETPREQAIIRSKYGTSKKMEQIREIGFNTYLRRDYHWAMIIRLGGIVWRPWKKTKFAMKVKRWLGTLR